MPELIDRQAALEKMCSGCKSGYDGHCPHPFGMCHEYESILQVPTIEAKPVRNGRWKCIGEYEEFSEEMADYLCENCGYVISRLKNQKPKFCEGCGADMREVREDATAVNRWIPVEDALPEDGELVLIAHVSGSVYIADREGKYWAEDSGEWYTDENVTHWMHLPEPPEKEK